MNKIISTLEDAQRQLDATANHLQEALSAANAPGQAKARFLAMMSHELRTPLNAVIGFSDLMRQQMLGPMGNPNYIEYANLIYESGERLLKTLSDVLDIARADAGHLTLYDEDVDLRNPVHKALLLVEADAASRGVLLGEKFEPNLPLMRMDERRVLQVLVNLLSNAVRFSHANGAVTISVFRSTRGVSIAICDSGIGIAEEDIPATLEYFSQVDDSLARKHDGAGLGLPLSKRLMELHGGSLNIDSTLGGGTTVTVEFPASRLVETTVVRKPVPADRHRTAFATAKRIPFEGNSI